MIFLAVYIGGQIDFFIFIEHGHEHFVISKALTFGCHVQGDVGDHTLQDWDDFFGESLEFFALLIKLVLLDWVIQMRINIEVFCVSLNLFTNLQFRHTVEHFLNITIWSSETSELLAL